MAQLEREIKQIQERLREQEAQRGCSLEEIATDMTRRQNDYNSAKLAIREMNQFVAVRYFVLSGRSQIVSGGGPPSVFVLFFLTIKYLTLSTSLSWL